MCAEVLVQSERTQEDVMRKRQVGAAQGLSVQPQLCDREVC